MIRIEHNVETGEIIEIEMSEEEIADFEQMVKSAEKERKRIANELESENEKIKAAKQIVLDRLGLTEDEARLLLG